VCPAHDTERCLSIFRPPFFFSRISLFRVFLSHGPICNGPVVCFRHLWVCHPLSKFSILLEFLKVSPGPFYCFLFVSLDRNHFASIRLSIISRLSLSPWNRPRTFVFFEPSYFSTFFLLGVPPKMRFFRPWLFYFYVSCLVDAFVPLIQSSSPKIRPGVYSHVLLLGRVPPFSFLGMFSERPAVSSLFLSIDPSLSAFIFPTFAFRTSYLPPFYRGCSGVGLEESFEEVGRITSRIGHRSVLFRSAVNPFFVLLC